MAEKFSLQKKITELEELESYFRKPDMDLQSALVKHTEALKIAKEILTYLKEAESKLEQINIEEVFSA